MSTYSIYCAHPLHASNSAYEGWYDGVLATVVLAAGVDPNPVLRGYSCIGCGVYDSLQPGDPPPPDPTPAGTANFMGRPVAGHRMQTLYTLRPLPERSGSILALAPFTVRSRAVSGARASNISTLAPALAAATGGNRVSNRSSLTVSRPLERSGARMTQHFVTLAHESGATTVTEESVSNGGWTSETNAQGSKNGTLAAFAGDALTAKTGRLVFAYADFPNKTPLTITRVALDFYVRSQGTALNNGDLRCQWRIGAGTIQTLETITGNVDSLTTPRTFDITSARSWTWADLDAFQALVYGETGAAENLVNYSCDAVHLRVEANRTDNL